MARKILLVTAGTLLVLLFLSWWLFKGTHSVDAWLSTNEVLRFAGWGFAWLCGLGGAALIAKALPLRSGDVASETNE